MIKVNMIFKQGSYTGLRVASIVNGYQGMEMSLQTLASALSSDLKKVDLPRIRGNALDLYGVRIVNEFTKSERLELYLKPTNKSPEILIACAIILN